MESPKRTSSKDAPPKMRAFDFGSPSKAPLQLPCMDTYSPQRAAFGTIKNFNLAGASEIQASPVKRNINIPTKYDVASNGTPVRTYQRCESNASFEKLLRAPAKANCVNSHTENESSLFIVHRQPSGMTGEESVNELQLERMADRNQFSYDSPDKAKEKSFDN